MDGPTDGRMDEQTVGGTDRPKSGLQRCRNSIKTFNNIFNVIELVETPFKQLCDRQTDGPTDQPRLIEVYL